LATTLSDINNLINDRRRDSGSNSVNMTTEGFRAINGTLDLWNQMHEWEFQIEETLINYNEGITWYSTPSNGTASILKAPVDLRYYKGGRTKEFDMTSSSGFDSDILTPRKFAISTKGQTEYLRIKAAGDKIDLDPATALTSNGTWVGATAISNVATDSYEFFDQNASLTFDYSGTSGTLTKTLTSGVDLSKYKNRSSVVWNHKSSTYTNWTSMTLKFGSSDSAYYTASVTSDYLSNDPTADQWNKFKIAWADLTTVGSPDITDIVYIQLTIAYSVNPANAQWIENLFVSENVPLVFEYYSNNMVSDSGTKTQKFTDSSDTNDTPLWTEKWDFITESFINSVLEVIFFITGEYTDMAAVQNKVAQIVNNLKTKLPSRRRYPEMAMKFDIE